MIPVRIIVCFGLLWIGTVAKAADYTDPGRIDDAYAIIDSSYPRYRDYWGAFSVASGLYNGVWGIIQLTSAPAGLGAMMGFGLSFTGWVTFFDGIRLLQGLSGIEVVAQRYQRYAPGTAKDFGGVVSREEFGRTRLRVLADEAYTGRIMRMASHLLSGTSLLYFFGTGSYSGSRYLLFPGIIMIGAGVYRLLQDSPEERAQMSLGSGHFGTGGSWNIIPGIGSAWMVARF